MVDVEMRLGGVELALFAQVDHRLSETFGIARFPVGARVVVREIDEHEGGVTDLRAHDVVDHASPGFVPHIDQVVSNLVANRGFDDFVDEAIEDLITEFHCDETM